jgi:hypothetical protein
VILQCPIDFLVPLLLVARGSVPRASLDWRTPGGREALDVIEDLGWGVSLNGVLDLESFVGAALLLPTSLTADFTRSGLRARARPGPGHVDALRVGIERLRGGCTNGRVGAPRRFPRRGVTGATLPRLMVETADQGGPTMITQERTALETPPRIIAPRPEPRAPRTPSTGEVSGTRIWSLLGRLLLVLVGFGLAMLGWSLMMTVFLVFLGLPLFIIGLAIMQAQES